MELSLGFPMKIARCVVCLAFFAGWHSLNMLCLEQKQAEVCLSSFHGMLDCRRLLSHELLVPAAHSHSVEVPPGDQDVGGVVMRGQKGAGLLLSSRFSLGAATGAMALAGGVWGWGAVGGGQFAIGISRGAGTWIPHITYGYGSGGAYTWAHGVGGSSLMSGSGLGFTTTYGAGPGTFLNITGIPVLAPGAIATWVGIRPDVGDCFMSCMHAFLRGW